MAQTGFVFHQDYLAHDMGPGHPESPGRLQAIRAHLQETGIMDRLVHIEAVPASDEWIMKVHTEQYLQTLKTSAPQTGRLSLDPDTSMSPGSLSAALLAAGGLLQAVDSIMAGQIASAFCAVRPPGHHAEADHAMGFCLLNNVAIAARYIQQRHGLKRILIVDWDVHHGNGTQHAFYEDPSVFFFSTHQFPFYPGTGRGTESGAGVGEGTTLNVPMSPGNGDEEYREVFQRILVPAADAFKPEFVIISAGFDAHRDDPLASMSLTEEGYKDLTQIIVDIATRHCQGRILSSLEGGYHLHGLSRSVEQHLTVLLDA